MPVTMPREGAGGGEEREAPGEEADRGGAGAVGEDAGERRDGGHEKRADGDHLARGVRAVAEHALHVQRQEERRAEGVAVEEPLDEERVPQYSVPGEDLDVQQRLRYAPPRSE